MKHTLLYILALVLTIAVKGQTLNVRVGSVTYQFPAAQTGEMTYADGTTLTVMGKTFTLADVDEMNVDATEVTDNLVRVEYADAGAMVYVAGNVAQYVTPTVSGAHVSIAQSNTDAVGDDEITYQLLGAASDGDFQLSGSYKCTVSLAGLALTNPNGAAINITNSKRIQISVKKGTENTLTDGTGSQKACIYSKGQIQLQGGGTLNVVGKTKHGIKSASYISIKNLTLNITSTVGDGISCEEYFQMKSGTVTITGVGDDGIQCDLDGETSTGETEGHEDEDSGNVYLEGGTLNLNITANAAKGIKAGGDIKISDGSITITQTGSITSAEDISYPTSIKADGNISIAGGAITITNTADGGKGISAEGTLTIDESAATTILDIKANGKGGTAETSGSSGDDTPQASYKLYVSLPTSGGGGGMPGGSNAWRNPVLYKSDGTIVASLTNTVTKSSGYSTVTFYYYDFGEAATETYYIKGDNYTSRNKTYTIMSATFSGPTSGTDIYYSISNSYSTSGTTRTYSLTNVTSTYGGTTDVSEDSGTAYNAIGMKADGDMTISAGTITIANSGTMSKSIKSTKNVTINGGTITLKPSGAMQVINNDASYCSGIKCDDFTLNDGSLDITVTGTAGRGVSADNVITNGGTLTITNSSNGQAGSNDTYTAKGIKADQSIALCDGTITITMSGTGGKGIKSDGTYSQGKSDGSGPTLKVTTTGSSLGSSSSSGGGWGGGFGQESSGSSAKGIKIQGAITIYGGTTEIYTSTNGAEGLESKTSITIAGGKHYLKCYDDCINSSGNIYFNGGVTVCYGYGNDAIDSNAGRTGAITIGDGVVFSYSTKGGPEEGFDCDNNSYIQITGTGIGISAGGSQGGGMGGSGSTISNAKQGYYFCTSNISYATGRYYTLADASGNNIVTYSFEASCSSSLALFTAKGMTKGSSYNVKYSTTAPTDATTAWHGLYLGSSAKGTTSVISFTAQ